MKLKAVGLFEEEVCVDGHSDRVGVLADQGSPGCKLYPQQLNLEWQLLSEKNTILVCQHTLKTEHLISWSFDQTTVV